MKPDNPARSATAVNADGNLLFGLLAFQNNFIDRAALLGAFDEWFQDKGRLLGQILRERGALSASRYALLEALVAEYIKHHGDDPEKSLAALSSIGSVRQDLSRIADPELYASLGHVSAARPDDDPFRTVSQVSLGAPSAIGARFRVLRPHARGGLGEVFLARDTELNRDVALKEIQDRYADDPRYRSRFEYEAEVTGGLEHPGIVPVYGLGHTADGRPFYAMRFIRGDSLKDAIRRFHEAEDQPGRDPGRSALELRELLGRFVDVCDAVAYAHSRGVLHRDLKPGNILLGRYGETLVVDWGLAKALEGPEEEPGATPDAEPQLRPASGSALEPTQAGSAVGTPGYMSPEQVDRRCGPLGIRSDVYCLGATLYHLLTGHAPCEAEPVGAIYQKILAAAIPRLRSFNSRLAPALEAICLKALALMPSDRYETAEALKADVERWLADEPVSAYAEPWSARLRRWARRHQRLVTGTTAAGVVAATALVVITAVISTSNRRLETTNQKLASANRTILENNEQITRQNQELAESNEKLKQARAEAEKERDQAKEVTEFLVSSFRKPDPAQDGKDVKVAELLGRAVQELEGRAKMAPATRAAILDAVGQTYYGLGLMPETVTTQEKTFALCRTALGEDHSDTLSAMDNLAVAYHHAGQLDRAITLHEQALKARRSKLGDDHPDTLISMNDLAETYISAGQLDRAITLHEQALKAMRAKLGGDHPDTLASLSNLAAALYEAGQLDRAITLHEQALKARRAKLGGDHPDTLISMNNLALGYQAAGQFDRAIPLYQQVLKVQRAKLGGDHPDTLIPMNNLAAAFYQAGQLDRAIPLYEQALTLRRTKQSEDHPDTLTAMNNLAAAYHEAGQLDRAIALYEQALKGRRAKLGDDHPSTIASMNNLATAYYDVGQVDRVIALYEQLLKVWRAKFVDDHPRTLTLMNNLALAFGEKGEVDRAIPLQEQALKGQQAKLGEDHPDTLRTQRGLARTYEKAGRSRDAEPLYRKTAAAARRQEPRNDRFCSDSLALLAHCLIRQGKHAEAVPILRECLEIKEKTDSGDWATANARSLLGEALTGQREFPAAEPLLLDGLKALTERREMIRPRDRDAILRDAIERLVRLYEAWGKPDQAAAWRKTLGDPALDRGFPADPFAK
jgi:serine/threonine protein kinase/lipopolysaccharide biosynthesis regulator YciM